MNFVTKFLTNLETSRHTLMVFIMDRKITDVTYVKMFLANMDTSVDTSKVFMKD